MNGGGVTHDVAPVFHDRNSVKFGAKHGWTVYAGHSCGACDGVYDKLHLLKKGSVVNYATRSGKMITGKVVSVQSIGPNASIADCYDLRGRGVCLVTCDERTRDANGVYHRKTKVKVTFKHG